MADNTAFTHDHHAVRVQDFPDESGQSESQAFPECRQNEGTREFLHQQLMRIIRNSSSTMQAERRQNDLLLSYNLCLHDLSIREMSRRCTKLKKEQLYIQHMNGWMQQEIISPIKEHEQADKQAKHRKEVRKNKKKTHDLRLPSITERSIIASISEEPTEEEDEVGPLPMESGVQNGVETKPLSRKQSRQRRVTISDTVTEHDEGAQRNLTAPATNGDQPPPPVLPTAKASTALATFRRLGKAAATMSAETKIADAASVTGKPTQPKLATVVQDMISSGATKNTSFFDMVGKAVGKSEDDKKKKNRTFLERNFCANKNRLFTRYLNAKKTFERDFTDDMYTKLNEQTANKMNAEKTQARRMSIDHHESTAPRKGSKPVLGRHATLNIIEDLKALNKHDEGNSAAGTPTQDNLQRPHASKIDAKFNRRKLEKAPPMTQMPSRRRKSTLCMIDNLKQVNVADGVYG